MAGPIIPNEPPSKPLPPIPQKAKPLPQLPQQKTIKIDQDWLNNNWGDLKLSGNSIHCIPRDALIQAVLKKEDHTADQVNRIPKFTPKIEDNKLQCDFKDGNLIIHLQCELEVGQKKYIIDYDEIVENYSEPEPETEQEIEFNNFVRAAALTATMQATHKWKSILTPNPPWWHDIIVGFLLSQNIPTEKIAARLLPKHLRETPEAKGGRLQKSAERSLRPLNVRVYREKDPLYGKAPPRLREPWTLRAQRVHPKAISTINFGDRQGLPLLQLERLTNPEQDPETLTPLNVTYPMRDQKRQTCQTQRTQLLDNNIFPKDPEEMFMHEIRRALDLIIRLRSANFKDIESPLRNKVDFMHKRLKELSDEIDKVKNKLPQDAKVEYIEDIDRTLVENQQALLVNNRALEENKKELEKEDLQPDQKQKLTEEQQELTEQKQKLPEQTANLKNLKTLIKEQNDYNNLRQQYQDHYKDLQDSLAAMSKLMPLKNASPKTIKEYQKFMKVIEDPYHPASKLHEFINTFEATVSGQPPQNPLVALKLDQLTRNALKS